MPGNRKDRARWLRLSGIGMEFAGAVAGFTLVGYWVDHHYSSSPKGVLVGAVLGILGGGYNLIRQALRATREPERSATDADGERRDD